MKLLRGNLLDELIHAAFVVAGFKCKLIRKKLNPKDFLPVNLEDEGVPSSSKILSVNVSPVGKSCFPNLITGNSLSPQIGMRFSLYGRPNSSVSAGESEDLEPEVTVNLMVIFEDLEKFDLANEYVYYAVLAYIGKKWKEVAINLHTATEIMISNLLEDYRRVSNDKKFQAFSRDETMYKKMNYYFPIITEAMSVDGLEDEIMKNLDSLRKCRNDAVHNGQGDEEIEKIAPELLSAVLFLKQYCHLIDEKLRK